MEGKDSHLAYEYTNGKTEGTWSFPAPDQPGAYTLRFYDRRQLVTQLPLRVELLKGGAALSLPRSQVAPGEALEVRFTAPKWFASTSWIGVYAQSAAPGMEGKDSQLSYQYTESREQGSMSLQAPPTPGSYQVRFYDRRQLVDQVSFAVRAP
jgi:hypothetical protein